MRPGSRASGLLLAVAVLSWPCLASAQSELQGTLSASTGWTDNYDATSSNKSDSAFLTLEPGGQLFVAGPSTVQRLAYRLAINLFLTGGGATSLSNNLSYDVNHTVSEFTDALFSAAVNHVTTNTASPVSTDVGGGGINAVPVGANQFLGFSLGAGLSHQISDLWRTTQGVNAIYTVPFDSGDFVPGATFNATAAVGLDRDLENANIGVNLGGTYTFIEGLGATGGMGAGPVEDQKQVILTGIARYTRPLTPEWTLDLSGGAAGAAPADDVGNLQFYPTGGGVLGWQVEKHSAGLSYNHGVNLNPFLRQTIVADDVVARGGIPLFSSRWALVGSVGYQHAHTLVFATGEAQSSLDLFSADAALAYEISPTMSVSARYQFNYQNGDSAVVPDLVRNAVSVVFSAKYPDRTKTVMPFRQPLKMLRDPTLGEPEDRPRARGGF